MEATELRRMSDVPDLSPAIATRFLTLTAFACLINFLPSTAADTLILNRHLLYQKEHDAQLSTSHPGVFGYWLPRIALQIVKYKTSMAG